MNAHFGNRTLKAVWIGSDAALSERIGAAIKDHAVSYDQRTPDIATRAGAANLAGADVIFMEIDGAADLEGFEALAVARSAEQRIVAVTTRPDAALLRQLIRLGASDWLTPDATEDDIRLACHAPKAVTAASGPRNVLIFTPVLGGMGATTLAIESAIFLSKGGKEPTCVVDLDFYAGECADFLNVEAKLAIDSLATHSEAIDHHLLESVLSEHESGIKLLAGKTHMGAHLTINPGAVLHLLNLVSGMFTNVIIDMPRAWQPWSDDIVMGADAVFLVTDGSVPALRAARRQLEEFAKRYAGRVKPRVIVNKYERTWFSTAISEKDLKASLGESFAGTVLDETKLAREAIDRGLPISAVKKNATLVKDIHTLLRKYVR